MYYVTRKFANRLGERDSMVYAFQKPDDAEEWMTGEKQNHPNDKFKMDDIPKPVDVLFMGFLHV